MPFYLLEEIHGIFWMMNAGRNSFLVDTCYMSGQYFAPKGSDKICMMMTRVACNWAIESSNWRMDNDSDVGLLMGYVLYRLPVELEFIDLDTFPRWFRLHPSLHTSC
jgi:hypothetical protein